MSSLLRLHFFQVEEPIRSPLCILLFIQILLALLGRYQPPPPYLIRDVPVIPERVRDRKDREDFGSGGLILKLQPARIQTNVKI